MTEFVSVKTFSGSRKKFDQLYVVLVKQIFASKKTFQVYVFGGPRFKMLEETSSSGMPGIAILKN